MKRMMTAVLAGLMVATVAFAQPTNPGTRQKGDRAAKMAEKLGLSAEQQTAIEAIRDRERAKFEAIHEQIGAKAVQYAKLRDANDPTAAKVKDEIKALREEMQIRRVAMRAEIDNVLTPEQLDQVKQMRATAKAHGRRGMGRRGGPNGGGPNGPGR